MVDMILSQEETWVGVMENLESKGLKRKAHTLDL